MVQISSQTRASQSRSARARSTGVKNTSTSKASRKKLEILEGASRVFRDRGLHATGMRDIAKESGMQVGNLYYYFRNKQDLLAFCQSHTLDGLLELTRRVTDTRLRSDTQLYLIILGHVIRLNEETPGSLAHLEIEALDSNLRRPILRQRDRYESAIRSIIEAGISGGVFRATDPKVASMALLGAVNWTVKWFQPEGAQSCKEIGLQFAELLVSGLLAAGQELHRPDEDHLELVSN